MGIVALLFIARRHNRHPFTSLLMGYEKICEIPEGGNFIRFFSFIHRLRQDRLLRRRRRR